MISSSKGVIKSGSDLYVESFSFPVQIPTVAASSAAKREKKTEPKADESAPDPLFGEETASSPETHAALEQAQAEAEELLRQAAEQAAEILKEAREEAENLKSQAVLSGREEGYRRGLEEGTADGQAKAGQLLKEQQEDFRESMEKAVRSVEAAKNACVEKHLDELKECSLAVAEKVICTSLRSSGQVIKRMLIAETEKLKKTDWVKIYMEKTDYSMMMEADADVVSELSKLSDNIKFVVMSKGDSGSCIIEMPGEIVDISVDTQMENIRDLLETIRV